MARANLMIFEPSTIVYLVLVGMLVLYVVDVFPPEIVAVASAVALWATGVLDVEQALAGFGNPTVVFVASLLVVAAALDASGVTAWAGEHLVRAAAGRARRLTLWTMVLSALLTSLITVHGAVAALIPVVVVTATRIGTSPSKLLLPLAFAAHAGSQLTLTGSQVNILFSDAADTASGHGFGFFEYTLVGLPLLGGAIVIVLVLGPRLLPQRTESSPAIDYTDHASVLADHYALDDRIGGSLYDRRTGTVELVIPPRSALIGTTVEPASSSDDGELVVLVVHRHGDIAAPGPTVLAAGDVLLVHGDWHDLAANLQDSDVLVVDSPDSIRRHAVPWGRGARRTVVVMTLMVVMLASGAVPAAMAGLLAAGSLILTRVLTIDEAYRGINWTTIVMIAGMIPLSTALTSSGAADEIARCIIDVVGEGSPHLLLVVLFVVTAALGQMISNTATALVVIPVAIAAAKGLDVSVRPILMSLNVVTVAALLTPNATAANTLVMQPGGYRFRDYSKLGLPLLAWWFVIAVGLVPLIWRF